MFAEFWGDLRCDCDHPDVIDGVPISGIVDDSDEDAHGPDTDGEYKMEHFVDIRNQHSPEVLGRAFGVSSPKWRCR
ncbi:MAG: hypothetical protein RL468_385 [Pseudomonadota bacterium]|jgi:hypothetical protein